MRRPLLLNGFMATGKSSVARLVAQRSGRELVDLDQRIESGTGQSVAEIFSTRGEAEFRRLERAELLSVFESGGERAPVIALGGGTLVQRETRLWALDRAVVVTLEASAAEILRRVGSPRTRPLLAGPDPEARAAELIELRQRSYAEAHGRVKTDGVTPELVAERVLEIWRQDGIAVAAGENSYAVEIGPGVVPARLPAVLGSPSRILLVTDKTVFGLHGARVLGTLGDHLRPTVVELVPGEEHKHIGSVERIWRTALESGADRSSLIVALGGGVVSDIAGFAAASYMRGIRWVGLPTTLLAMVDASVGGKTGVDLGAAKNAVGAFWQPNTVLCDVEHLRTESDRGFRSALAEVVKTALVGDRGLLELLESAPARVAERAPELLEEIVRRSIRVKARIVSQDEREGGLRAVLNLGHTIGHALEAQAGYSRLTHGEAISLGLVAALRVGVALRETPAALADRVVVVLGRLGLPVDLSAEPMKDAVSLIGHDKKRAGRKLRFVLARDVERVETVELELEQVQKLALSLA
jgi:shikimate kinase / 3-dehydroquinate synthase